MGSDAKPVFAGIEAGGTSFVVGAGTGPADLLTREIATTTPEETLGRTLEWLRSVAPREGFRAIGIASFGPVQLNPESPQWGFITNTPKTAWRDFAFAPVVQAALGIPVAFDTDVNAALAGEAKWGAARGIGNCLYLTVGTGIGGAALSAGVPLNGARHAEMGHIRVPRDRAGDPFPGVCPFHGDCLEGLASGPAIAERWRTPPENLDDNHPAWQLEAEYLAQAIAAYTCILSPSAVILGGGVMKRARLYGMIGTRLAELLAGYVPVPELLSAALGPSAGVLGAIAMAATL